MTKKELELDLQEVRAYRELQRTPFDFGTGLITNDNPVSEDAYYKREEQLLEELLDEFNDTVELQTKPRLSPYKAKIREKKHIIKLHQQGVPAVYVGTAGLLKRLNLTSCKKVAKKNTNKRVRALKDIGFKCGEYRKTHDYNRDLVRKV